MTEPPAPGAIGCPDLPGRDPGESWTWIVRAAAPQRDPAVLRRVLHGLENLPDTALPPATPGCTPPR